MKERDAERAAYIRLALAQINSRHTPLEFARPRSKAGANLQRSICIHVCVYMAHLRPAPPMQIRTASIYIFAFTVRAGVQGRGLVGLPGECNFALLLTKKVVAGVRYCARSKMAVLCANIVRVISGGVFSLSLALSAAPARSHAEAGGARWGREMTSPQSLLTARPGLRAP